MEVLPNVDDVTNVSNKNSKDCCCHVSHCLTRECFPFTEAVYMAEQVGQTIVQKGTRLM